MSFLVSFPVNRVLTKCVGQVEDIRASDLNLFPEYIIPYLTSLKTDSEVRARHPHPQRGASLLRCVEIVLTLCAV